MPIFDTHAHLDDDKYLKDLDNVVLSFTNANNRILCVATGINSSKRCSEIANNYSFVFFSAGIHPNSITQNPENSIELLDIFIKDKKPIALGEIGLDRFRDYTPFDLQIQYFVAQIQLARKYNLPILIHCRDAWNDMLPLLETEVRKYGPIKGVIHSFTGNLDHAEKCIKLGLYLSFAGMLTYKKNDALRRVAAKCPIEKILVETDAPYLAPEPFRGKRNEPSFINYTVKTLAEILNVSMEELENQLWINSNKVLNLPS
ncbi:MAG: TatD family deoxyribonuclease [Planctomycetes bacterium]|nr:TatD family deoxyribonuclease [Planctomycetota bacterium]